MGQERRDVRSRQECREEFEGTSFVCRADQLAQSNIEMLEDSRVRWINFQQGCKRCLHGGVVQPPLVKPENVGDRIQGLKTSIY